LDVIDDSKTAAKEISQVVSNPFDQSPHVICIYIRIVARGPSRAIITKSKDHYGK
jgi:hypothetical protein